MEIPLPLLAGRDSPRSSVLSSIETALFSPRALSMQPTSSNPGFRRSCFSVLLPCSRFHFQKDPPPDFKRQYRETLPLVHGSARILSTLLRTSSPRNFLRLLNRVRPLDFLSFLSFQIFPFSLILWKRRIRRVEVPGSFCPKSPPLLFIFDVGVSHIFPLALLAGFNVTA